MTDYAELMQRFAALASAALSAGDAEARVEVVAGHVRLTAVRGPAPRVAPEVEGNIVDALAEADGPLTGQELAKVAGYSFTGRFRTTLAELTRRGVIANHNPGYALAGQTERRP